MLCIRFWSVMCAVLCVVMNGMNALYGFAPLPTFSPKLALHKDEGTNKNEIASIDSIWSTHYLSALRQAQRENKVLLLLFTGSDWCTWCRRMEEEILERRECLSALSPYCVFVKLDYPRSSALISPEEMEQNAALQRQYAVTHFPTVLVVDAHEHVLGKTGYVEGGPSCFNKTILHMVSER